MPRPSPKPIHRKQPAAELEVVDPVWLLKALGFTLLAALICGYLTFCLLFYQGQWQLVLHPDRTTNSPPEIAGAPYNLIHFAPDESAVPQLTGWWIPASPGSRFAHTTILFECGSDGSLAASISTLATLHELGINVFGFDYRGYGQSAATHPSQQSMTQDTESAWKYLMISRAIPPQQIVPYGIDIGAALAVHLAANHPAIPAIILDSGRGDLLATARRDRRSALLPVRLLFHDRFPLANPLSILVTPKLLLSRAATLDPAYRTAADPKLTVEFASPSQTLYRESLTRFLDQYLPPTPVPQLVPSPAPSAPNHR